MDTDRNSQSSADREKWGKILNALVLMLRNQQNQIQSLVEERKHLEVSIDRQNGRWVSQVRLLEGHISQMKREFVIQEMAYALEAAKCDMMLGMKQREAFLYKRKLEVTESDMADFRVGFDYLCHKCSNAEGISHKNFIDNLQVKGGGTNSHLKSFNSTKGEEQISETMEGEMKRLKRDYAKLSSKTSDKILALSSERNFIWKQYEKMEREYTSKLNVKKAEVEEGKEKIEKLIAGMEELQSTNNTKDETIEKLKAKVAEMETDKNKKDEEIFRLSKELELSKKSSCLVTPVLNHCTAEVRNSMGGKENGIMDSTNVLVKKELLGSQMPKHVKDSKKGCRSLKRKDSSLSSGTPKLFSSAFKVPKLKNPSPCIV